MVLDDVLELRPGDQVPVDGVVLLADGLEADEALLTGEAEPVAKQPGERVLSGSFVVAGTGRVRAAGVGGQAYAAQLQAQARRFSLIRSELQQGGAEPAALVVLAEELRQDAAATVRYLLGQGVAIKVLSGDAPRAVAAIAERAGIPVDGIPVDASALSEDEDEGLADALAAASVFGRVRPGHKLAAVRALQAGGHVVAMVGDGVNDVQALKQADLGIAMGSGSQASRSVARVVLLDGTFAAIPRMLDEGRRVIANIERVAGLFVTKTVYAAIIAVAIGAAGITYPFYPRLLTIISTLTIGVPGFFLALAPGAPRAQPGFTRRVLAFTIPAGTAAAAAGLAAYAIARATPDVSATAARTAAMLAVFASASGCSRSSPGAPQAGPSPWSPPWPASWCCCSPCRWPGRYSPWNCRPSPSAPG